MQKLPTRFERASAWNFSTCLCKLNYRKGVSDTCLEDQNVSSQVKAKLKGSVFECLATELRKMLHKGTEKLNTLNKGHW